MIFRTEAIGHAVRAGYLYSAMADVAALTGDTALLHAVDTIWGNVVSKKMYVQGGVGAVGNGERFGDNYELPNATAYNETCAAIAQIFWNQRMFHYRLIPNILMYLKKRCIMVLFPVLA